MIVETKNLSCSYTAGEEVLKDVTLSLEEGKYYCLIGHNGSGKSTFAKCLMGLISDYQGQVFLFGEEVNRKNRYALHSRVGIVFQNPDNQFVGSTVADDIAFGLENKRVPREEMEAIIHHFAKETGVEEFLDHEPTSLSGGQKQRVAIAGVLAMNPDLLILDEATAMLDPKGKAEVLDLIHRLRKEKPSLTVLSITHDVEEAASADYVHVLNAGQLFLSGKPEEVFAHTEELRSIHLGVPFVYELKEALIGRGISVPKDILTLEALEAYLCR